MNVSDSSSHRRDQIANFAEILRGASARQKVFGAVYRGKKRVKTIAEIASATGFSAKRVATIARPLAHGEKLFEQDRMKIKRQVHTVYRKIDFVVRNKQKILSLANSKSRLARYHTKTNPRSTGSIGKSVTIRVPFRVKVDYLNVEDIGEFAKVADVKSVPTSLRPPRLPEARLKKGFITLLGHTLVPKDWGGEGQDIFTTRLTIGGKKHRGAFALKGPATKGPLVPGKMGHNGDQIQRLFDAPADVFLVQYEGEVKESIHKLMEQLGRARAVTGEHVWWCVIDGDDTRRLRAAYPRAFK